MYVAHKNSRLASYGSHVVYQGVNGEVRDAHYECHGKDACWHDRILNTTKASNGTQLALIPLQNRLSSLGLFYQEEGGRFLKYAEDEDSVGSLWENRESAPLFCTLTADSHHTATYSNLIPSNGSVAAFSTARKSSLSNSDLKTYLLWQDANDTVQISWTDDDSGWRGPVTSPAFAGIEPGSALACFNGLTFEGFPLRAGTELARCYFQTGRALREVRFDGKEWEVVGVIPVDL